MTDMILVIGRRLDGELSAFWGGYIDEGSDMEPHPTLEPGGGGGPAEPPTHEFSHSDSCSTEDGAAAQVAGTIMATDDTGPNLFDWTTAEYVATITEKEPGVFGAYSNNAYSQGELSNASMTAPDTSTAVRGIVHNHPLALGEQLGQRYPSRGDWDALDRLHERYGAAQGNFDPAIWILDSFGVTRRFARSERAHFDSLSANDREAREGLGGREVDDNDC